MACSRAPAIAFFENSASAPVIASVFGFGSIVIAAAKYPAVIASLPCGPYGIVWKIARIVELVVDRQRQRVEHRDLVLHQDRHRRGAVIGAGGDDQIDLVDIEQLCVDARDQRRVALVVVVDQLDRPAEQPAFLVDVVGPDLRGQQELLAAGRAAAGLLAAEPDPDRLRGNRRR